MIELVLNVMLDIQHRCIQQSNNNFFSSRKYIGPARSTPETSKGAVACICSIGNGAAVTCVSLTLCLRQTTHLSTVDLLTFLYQLSKIVFLDL